MVIPWAMAPMFLITDMLCHYSGCWGRGRLSAVSCQLSALSCQFSLLRKWLPRTGGLSRTWKSLHERPHWRCAEERHLYVAFQFMTSHGSRSSLLLLFCVIFFIFFSGRTLGQESDRKTVGSPSRSRAERDGDRPYRRDDLSWNWNQRGRSVPPGESAAGLRFRAYRQKMAFRAQRAAAAASTSTINPPKLSLGGAPASPLGSTVWVSLGPAPLASDATGDGAQDYNWVSGRATSVLIDP